MGYGTGLWRSTDGGLSWTEIAVSPAIPSATAIRFAPSSGSVVYLSTWGSVWLSSDAGLTFTEILPGITAMGGYAADLFVNPVDEKNVLVHAPNVGLFVTQDGGTTWALRTTRR